MIHSVPCISPHDAPTASAARPAIFRLDASSYYQQLSAAEDPAWPLVEPEEPRRALLGIVISIGFSATVWGIIAALVF